MLANIVKINRNTTTSKSQLLENGTENQHMSTPEKVSAEQEEHATSTTTGAQMPPPTIVGALLNQLRSVISTCLQQTMQHVTNARNPDRPTSKFINWSYRMLRRKQLLFLFTFIVLILYLSCTLSISDYSDDHIPVLHYSHVPGMKAPEKLIDNNLTTPIAFVPHWSSSDATILNTTTKSNTETEITKKSFTDFYTNNTLNSDTNNITQPPAGYLVWSDSCRIPDLDVNSPDIMQYFKREKYKPCSNKKPLTTVAFNQTSREYLLQIEEKLIETYSKSGRIKCCYQSITRNGTGTKADDDYRLGKCVPFKKSVSLPSEIESILVQCNSNKRNIYKNGHPLIAEHPEVTERLNSWKEKDKELLRPKPPSILMIGIDSISRVNLIRSMPKTAQHLYDNDWFELTGYNKIDDNTFPNLMALLAGYNKSITDKKCPPYRMGALDNCSLIWKTFREHGYVTGYGEDAAEISTFNYFKVGFTKPPVDYYLRPFQLAAEHKLSKTTKSGLTFCLGYQQSAQFVLEYAIEFATRFKDDPLFGLFWANSFSHNDLSDASSMDIVILNYLERLSITGILDRMIVVFFSDHGLRFGPARSTPSGHMEERLPFIFMWLPQYLKHKYPKFVNALSVNKNRLSTPYDLHMTLKHFLNLSERVAKKDQVSVLSRAEACPNCQSLLKPLPLDRSCDEAAIAEHWCTCIPYSKVDKKMNVVEKLGYITVDYINKLVREFKNGTIKKLCRNLHLSNVLSAYRANEAFRPKDPKNGVLLDVYRLQLTTKPNSANFEVTLRYNPKTEAVDFTGEISRLDTYSKDSHCMSDSFVKKYCSCA